MEQAPESPAKRPPTAAPTVPRAGFHGPDKPAYEDYAHCVHCGLCLNNCPTYRLWGLEADFAAGRIRQMVLVDEGRLPLGDSCVRHIDSASIAAPARPPAPRASNTASSSKPLRAQIEQNIAVRSFALGAQLGLSSSASVSAPHRSRGASDAILPALRRAIGRARLRRLAFARPCRSRTPDAPDRMGIFLLADWDVLTGPRSPPRARGVLRRMHRAGEFLIVARGHDPRAHRQRLRSRRPKGTNLLRRACRARRSARDRPARRPHKSRCLPSWAISIAIVTNTAGCGSTLKEYDQLFSESDPAHQQH